MPVIASKPKGGSYLTPAGTHQAVCYGVWDIGLQKQEWQGNVKFLRKIVISWEIGETIDDPDSEYHGKRYVISQFYTLSLASKANLKRDLEAWRGNAFTGNEMVAFDVETLVGANCLLNVIHKETESATYANLAGVMPLPKGTPMMTPENSTKPPQWVKDKAADGQANQQAQHDTNHQQFQEPPPPMDEPLDDLPF